MLYGLMHDHFSELLTLSEPLRAIGIECLVHGAPWWAIKEYHHCPTVDAFLQDLCLPQDTYFIHIKLANLATRLTYQ